MRLFVDCDDTLVLWKYEEIEVAGRTLYTLPNEGEKYTVNLPLIDAVRVYMLRHPECTLVIWSGGGVDYAARWARKFFEGVKYLIENKNVKYPQEGDICVDDILDLKVVAKLYTPQEAIERLNEEYDNANASEQ